MYEWTWRSVDYAPDSAQQSGPCLIVKNNHDARVWQLLHFIGFSRTATEQSVQQQIRTNILQCTLTTFYDKKHVHLVSEFYVTLSSFANRDSMP